MPFGVLAGRTADFPAAGGLTKGTRMDEPGRIGRDEEFTAFVAARWTSLLLRGYLLTGSSQAAEDLVQTALAKAYVAWPRIKDLAAAEGYVRRIMVTTYTSWWRGRRLRETPTGHPEDGPDRSPAEDELQPVLDRSVLWPHLAALPRGQRAAVVLRFYEDLSEAQTAAVLGCSVGTVKSQTHPALASLRGALTAPGGPADSVTQPEPQPREA